MHFVHSDAQKARARFKGVINAQDYLDMTDLTSELARIDLYKDIAKIGIPALIGLVAGLIPYFLEKQKIKDVNSREQRKFHQSLVSELIECFSDYSGAYFRYVALVGSKARGSSGEKMRETAFEAGNETLLNGARLKKARSIAALLGNKDLVSTLDEFDEFSKKAINKILENPKINSLELISEVKNKEKDVLENFNSLLVFKSK